MNRIIGFFNAIDTVCITCATKRSAFLAQHDTKHTMHDYTQDSPLRQYDADKDGSYTCALCGKDFPTCSTQEQEQEQEQQKIIVGYTHDYYAYHTHCLPQGYEGKPAYLHQRGTRTALCYACGNGLLYDYTSPLQASRSFLVATLDACNVAEYPDTKYREATRAFILSLLTLAYSDKAEENFPLLMHGHASRYNALVSISSEDVMRSVIYNEIVRLYALPYAERKA